MRFLGQLNHPNLVRLVGYCSEGAQRDLVYEYMQNGSLDKWLFTSELTTPTPPPLDPAAAAAAERQHLSKHLSSNVPAAALKLIASPRRAPEP